jgi:glucose/arabinose dehydrogenase
MYGIVRYSFAVTAAFCLVSFAGGRAIGQVLKGEAAYGSWHDDKPGVRRLLTPEDLPPIAKPTYALAQAVPIPTGALPQVPDGFSVQLVTSALRKPRVIRVAPNGDLFVADTMFNAVHVLRIPAGSAKPIRDEIFASGLKQPFGIAFYPLGPHPQWVYIANSDGVVRFRYKNGDLKATGKSEQIVVGIPKTHHYARDIAFSSDGKRLFFSVGSRSNVAQDMFPEPHLTMHPAPHIVNALDRKDPHRISGTFDHPSIKAGLWQRLSLEARRPLIEISIRSTPSAANFIRNGNGSPGNARDTIPAQSRDAR